MDDDRRRMKPEVLAALLGTFAAGSEPQRDDHIPDGWECNGCGGTMSHHPSCKPPRSLKKSEA